MSATIPVSGRRMQRFLQLRLGSHQLPGVLGCFAGGQHVARANRVCIRCVGVAVADEMHMIAKQVNTWPMLRAFSRNAN